HPKHLLLSGTALQAALEWSSRASGLTALDQEFLEESRLWEAARPPDWEEGRAGRNLFVLLGSLLGTGIGVGLVLAYADEGGMPPPVDTAAGLMVTGVIAALAYLNYGRLSESKENRQIITAMIGTSLLVVVHRALYIPEYLWPSLESNVASRIISGDHFILAAAAFILGITTAPWALRLVPVFIGGAVVSRFILEGPGRVGAVVLVLAIAIGLHAMSNPASGDSAKGTKK
ncbi:MAG TPA: hypothetical protein PLA94_05235, partial [Myxococcota bacterium]|nr:hypothetical protein [Myxococcota bacterium]